MKSKKGKLKIVENWQNIRIRSSTLKRLRFQKVQMEVPVYDDVIQVGLNLIDKENK